MLAAGVLEVYRKHELRASGGLVQELADNNFNSSHISIFAQVPQFALIGASEVFASISGRQSLVMYSNTGYVDNISGKQSIFVY